MLIVFADAAKRVNPDNAKTIIPRQHQFTHGEEQEEQMRFVEDDNIVHLHTRHEVRHSSY